MQIAMKDLEIRGAGNLLGGEQSGHIAGVGFDLYVRLVGEAVADFRGDGRARSRPRSRSSCRSTPTCRTTTCRASGCGSRPTADRRRRAPRPAWPRSRAELRDRYGTPPEPVENLLAVARLRTHARKARVTDVSVQGNYVRFAPRRAARESSSCGCSGSTREPGQGHGPYHSRPQADDGAGRWPAAAGHGGAGWASDLIHAVLLDQMADAARVAAQGKERP